MANSNIIIKELLINEDEQLSGVFATSLVSDPAIEVDFVALSSKEIEVIEFSVDDEKMILTGPLLIPNQMIFRSDKMSGDHYVFASEKTIEQASLKFFKDGNQNSTTHQHSKVLDGNTIFESWIIKDSKNDKANSLGFDLPEGTWMISVKVKDKEYWDKYIKSGKIKGFSLEGLFSKETVENPDSVIKKDIKKTSNFSNNFNTQKKSNNKLMNLIKKFFEAFSTEKVELAEYMLPDGGILITDEEGKSPIFDKEGNQIGYVQVIIESEEEITSEEAQIEEEMEEMKKEEKVEEKIEEKENFKNEFDTKLNQLINTFDSFQNKISEIEKSVQEMKNTTFSKAETTKKVDEDNFNITTKTQNHSINDFLKFRKNTKK